MSLTRVYVRSFDVGGEEWTIYACIDGNGDIKHHEWESVDRVLVITNPLYDGSVFDKYSAWYRHPQNHEPQYRESSDDDDNEEVPPLVDCCD